MDISTHAPLAGRDASFHTPFFQYMNFNPRAPCGARRFRFLKKSRRKNFNPRAPCGARRATLIIRRSSDDISTHAPLAGRDR